MARATAITNSKCYGPNVVAVATANSVSANTAFYVDTNELDERTVFLYVPSAADGALTVTAGTGYDGTTDLTLACGTSGGQYFFTLDSARYAIASGENVGLIKITATKAGTFSVLQPKV